MSRSTTTITSSSSSSYESPLSQPRITLDPQNDGHTIRLAFLIEAVLNLCSLPLLIYPQPILYFILLSPSQITPSTVLFTRLFSGLIVGGLTTALLLGLPNTARSLQSRPRTYLILGAGECILIPVLVFEALKKGDVNTAGLSPLACVTVIGMLLPPLLWRIYVLFVNPNLLGRYKVAESESGKKNE